MKVGAGIVLTLSAIVSPGVVLAQDQPLTGYLPPETLAETVQVIGPPPPVGSSGDVRDRDVYRQTRALDGTSRFALATNDAVIAPQPLADDFACAMGKRVDVKAAPVLTRLLSRSSLDGSAASSKGKTTFKRQRPFVGSSDAICTPDDARIEGSFAYPSGHATLGWIYGQILSELMPDRTVPLMTRARIYGDSRVVCGVHTVSDIDAGAKVAQTVVARLHGNAEFQADLTAAKAELASVQGTAPDANVCAIEEAAKTRAW